MSIAPLLEVKGLTKNYAVGRSALRGKPKALVRALDDVSFTLRRGESLGIVGESGCGKSTLARCILRLTEPTSGQVLFEGKDVLGYSRKRLRGWRRHAQIIFQDPYGSLDRRFRAEDIVAEPLRINGLYDSYGGNRYVRELFGLVGLKLDSLKRYPHEFSGGQRQRLVIARALALKPSLIVCDEPVSSLDVSTRSQIVNLLKNLQQELGLTYLFIGHDLALVRYMCESVVVMYLGRVVESGDRSVYERPAHPYTRTLMSAVPTFRSSEASSEARILPKGDIPSPENPPSGCAFHPRCFYAQEICSTERPDLRSVGSQRSAACFFPYAYPGAKLVAEK